MAGKCDDCSTRNRSVYHNDGTSCGGAKQPVRRGPLGHVRKSWDDVFDDIEADEKLAHAKVADRQRQRGWTWTGR